MKTKLIIGFLMGFSSLSFAGPTFMSQGKGYFCYQDYPSALQNAVSEADSNAQRICRTRPSQRVSQFSVQKSPQGCVVVVRAKYTCR